MRYLIGFGLLLTVFGCRVYNQNIMFQTKESIIQQEELINQNIRNAEKNYTIQKGDYIEVRVFTNKGEVILSPLQIDPTNPNLTNIQLQNQMGGQGMNQAGANPQAGQFIFQNAVIAGTQYPLNFPTFLIQQDGIAKLPIVGAVPLAGLTLNQADSLLETKFATTYEEPFVRTRYTNKRVIVFKGATGLIFPLRNEKVSLIELLSATGGVDNLMRASNIRLIRGDLRNPTVYLINLRTIKGLTMHDLTLEPNDIVYIEPIRKTVFEAIGDVSPLLSLVTSILTLILVINR
ncbi:MAG: polysaccharide biosynthesis/export family protein [Microscillaceae bacterium]|jgi:polysaccharide export outer membrane protein|nr:polysaccharide biosynthesis/export family protein [Microscillaceae bacterium]